MDTVIPLKPKPGTDLAGALGTSDANRLAAKSHQLKFGQVPNVRVKTPLRVEPNVAWIDFIPSRGNPGIGTLVFSNGYGTPLYDHRRAYQPRNLKERPDKATRVTVEYNGNADKPVYNVKFM